MLPSGVALVAPGMAASQRRSNHVIEGYLKLNETGSGIVSDESFDRRGYEG